MRFAAGTENLTKLPVFSPIFLANPMEAPVVVDARLYLGTVSVVVGLLLGVSLVWGAEAPRAPKSEAVATPSNPDRDAYRIQLATDLAGLQALLKVQQLTLARQVKTVGGLRDQLVKAVTTPPDGAADGATDGAPSTPEHVKLGRAYDAATYQVNVTRAQLASTEQRIVEIQSVLARLPAPAASAKPVAAPSTKPAKAAPSAKPAASAS